MLDQTTDRMWYVIGAVLIGAAIIFGMNTFMPEAFASVGGMFDDFIGKVAIGGSEDNDEGLEEYLIRTYGVVDHGSWQEYFYVYGLDSSYDMFMDGPYDPSYLESLSDDELSSVFKESLEPELFYLMYDPFINDKLSTSEVDSLESHLLSKSSNIDVQLRGGDFEAGIGFTEDVDSIFGEGILDSLTFDPNYHSHYEVQIMYYNKFSGFGYLTQLINETFNYLRDNHGLEYTDTEEQILPVDDIVIGGQTYVRTARLTLVPLPQ